MDTPFKTESESANHDKGYGNDGHGEGGSSKHVSIMVNGRNRTVSKDEVTFEEIVKLAFPTPPPGQNILYTVTYRRGEGNKQGTLVEGATIKVKEGMIFYVTPTDRS